MSHSEWRARSRTVTKAERSWILYDCANSAQTLIVTTAILPIFFKTVAAEGMSASDSTYYWALGNTVASIVVAILAPVLGALADHRGNKKRFFVAFLLAGVVATASLTVVGAGAWKLCLLLYGLSTIGFYGAIVFYDSFLVDVTEKERMDWVSSSGFAWGYIVSVVPYIGCMALIQFCEPLGLSKINATRICFVITAVWWFVLTIPMLRNVHQRYYAEDTPNPVRESLSRLAATLRDIPRYKHLFIFLIAYFLYIDGVHTIYKMSMAFGLDVGIKASELMLVLLVTQIAAFPCALIYGKLAGIFTAKRMILVGIATYFAVVVVAFFISKSWHFWVLAMLVATAQGGIQSLSRSIYGKLVPKQRSAQFFGFYDIFGKFAAILGPFMVGYIGHLAGNTRVGVFSLIALFFLGGALLLSVREEQAVVEE
ncbi:MAG: MFS transporter [Candidatus Hydrogenedentes bacterium]|nr:MFS transporter [Candidatus Hydrogenedentota bacterium]